MSAAGYGLGLLCVGLAVAIGCGAVAVGATRGWHDGEDSGRPEIRRSGAGNGAESDAEPRSRR